MRKTALVVAMIGASVVGVATAFATIEMQKKAKAAGFDVQNCLYCHSEKLPKKGTPALNDRGNWLKVEKEKRKAKEIDFSWLKEYVEKK
jgi:hypothetical protein